MNQPGQPARRARRDLLVLPLLAALGAAIVAVSLIPAWLIHVRNVGGHGLTAISVAWSAWEGRAWPFLPIAVVVAGALALLASLDLARRGIVPRGWPAGLALVSVGLLVGTAIPLNRQGYASAVHLTPGWALLIAVALAALAALAAVLRLDRGRWLVVAALAVVAMSAAAFGGRVVALNLAEGNPRHYADGSYQRAATADEPAETLVISDGTFTIGERWSGSISGRGLVAVLTDDPACPTDRGAYRVFAAGGDDISFNLIVDLCADGKRASDLTTGTWRRIP